jgi:hypothetical protein
MIQPTTEQRTNRRRKRGSSTNPIIRVNCLFAWSKDVGIKLFPHKSELKTDNPHIQKL